MMYAACGASHLTSATLRSKVNFIAFYWYFNGSMHVFPGKKTRIGISIDHQSSRF